MEQKNWQIKFNCFIEQFLIANIFLRCGCISRINVKEYRKSQEILALQHLNFKEKNHQKKARAQCQCAPLAQLGLKDITKYVIKLVCPASFLFMFVYLQQKKEGDFYCVKIYGWRVGV